MVCVVVDANRLVKLLALARVGSETKDNWVWFEGVLKSDIPGTQFLHADYCKGVENAQFKTMLSENKIKYGQWYRYMLNV